MGEEQSKPPVSGTNATKANAASERRSDDGATAHGGAGTPYGASVATEIPKWLVPAAFFVGGVFLCVILALVGFIPTPTPPQFHVFKIILSLCGASFVTGT